MTKLRQVADILKEQGWTQGVGMDDEGRFCLIGGLMEAYSYDLYGGTQEYRKDRDMLSLIARARGYASAVHFNDAEGQTFDDVLNLIHNAATTLEREENA